MAHDVDGFVLVSMPPPAVVPVASVKFENVRETVEVVSDKMQGLLQKVERAIDEVDGRKFATDVAKGAAILAFSTAFPMTAVVFVPTGSYLHGKFTKEIGDGRTKVTLHTPLTK